MSRGHIDTAECPYVAAVDMRECHAIQLPIFFFFHAPPHLIIYLFTWFLCPSAKKIWWHFEKQTEFCDDDIRSIPS